MIRTLLLDADGHACLGGEELIAHWREAADSRIWIDLQGESAAREHELLEAFGCHPMAIDDASVTGTRRRSKSSTIIP